MSMELKTAIDIIEGCRDEAIEAETDLDPHALRAGRHLHEARALLANCAHARGHVIFPHTPLAGAAVRARARSRECKVLLIL